MKQGNVILRFTSYVATDTTVVSLFFMAVSLSDTDRGRNIVNCSTGVGPRVCVRRPPCKYHNNISVKMCIVWK